MESDDTRKFDEFDDLLSRYLKGQLSEEEEAEFHRLISDDAELRNKAVATARLARAMEQVGPECDRAIIDAIKTLTLDQAEDLADNNSERFWLSPPGVYRACCLPENYREERKKIRAKLRKKLRKNRKPPIFGKFMARLTAAAAIVACLWGGYRVFIYEPPHLSSAVQTEILAMLSEPQYVRGEGDGMSRKLNELYHIIVVQRQSASTIGELEDMWNKSRRDTYNDCTEHMPDIGLLLACAYINNRSYDQAIDVLDILLADYPAGTPVGTEALAIKEKINEFLPPSHR